MKRRNIRQIFWLVGCIGVLLYGNALIPGGIGQAGYSSAIYWLMLPILFLTVALLIDWD